MVVKASSACVQPMMCCYRVLCLLDDLRGDVADAVSFRTPSCEPDAPSPPKLHARTVNSITLKWNVCSDLLTLHTYFYSALVLLFRQQEGHLACKMFCCNNSQKLAFEGLA